MIAARAARAGSYGDPAMVPVSVWADLMRHCKTRTGYTHQSQQTYFDAQLLDVCMLSADSAEHRDDLRTVFPGARAFTVYGSAEALQASGDVWCPADDKRPGGKRVGCADCGLCFGADRTIEDRDVPTALQQLRKGPKNVGILVHGTWAGEVNPLAKETA